MGNNIHVTKRKDGNWQAKKEGAKRASAIRPTQTTAGEKARDLAIKSKAEVVTHRPNGQIRDKDSYGNDPCPPRDKKH